MKQLPFFAGVVLGALLFTSAPARAGWMANADFSGCPRQYISQTSGQEGPFDSESACNSRVAQVKGQLACARYWCASNGGGESTSANPAAPGHAFDKTITDALSAGMQGKISAGDSMGLVTLGLLGNALTQPSQPTQPETPEQRAARVEAERQAAERAEQARLAELAYQQAQDKKAIGFLDEIAESFRAPPVPPGAPPDSKNFRAKINCKGGEPGLHTCYVMVCGGAYGGDPVCCPEGFPKLNECDCNCYPSNADFECKRYAACQYSIKVENNLGGGQ